MVSDKINIERKPPPTTDVRLYRLNGGTAHIQPLRDIDDTKVSFINLQDLIEAKLNAGRLQDLADADHLKKISARKGRKK